MMETTSILVHDYFPDRYPPATEYFLPCKDMPVTVSDSLHPWLRQLLGCEPGTAKNVLERRWGGISVPSLVELREFFLRDFQPQSIFSHQNEAWLCLAPPTRTLPDSPGLILVPPPPDQEKLKQGLAKCPFANEPVLHSFMNHFGAIREEIPPTAGSFLIPEPWETLLDCWGENDAGCGEWYTQWSGALIVYGAISGDMVLLHPQGNLAWLGFAEREVWPLADNFDAFVRLYTGYRRKTWHSLDGDILQQSC